MHSEFSDLFEEKESFKSGCGAGGVAQWSGALAAQCPTVCDIRPLWAPGMDMVQNHT